MTTPDIEHGTKINYLDETRQPFRLSEDAVAELLSLFAYDREAYDDRVDDLAASYLLFHTPEFAQNIKDMRASRTHRAQCAIRDRQLELLADARLKIAGEYGLPSQSEFDETKEKVADALIATGCKSPLEIDALRILGIISSCKDGSWYHYPYGLFPATVNAAWCRYLSAADDHEKYASLLRKGAQLSLQTLVMEKDRARRIAHNALATYINDIFGIDSLDDGRDLVAMMRDHAPYVSGQDKADSSANRLAPGMTVARAMHRHLLPEYDSLPDPERCLYY